MSEPDEPPTTAEPSDGPEGEPDADPAAEPDEGAAAEPDADPDPDPDAELADERATIRAGRDFETGYRLDAAEAGAFLVALGEQLRDDDELTLRTDEWELPFAFGEPVELEIDFEGVDEPELEIELDIPGRTDERAPEVE